MPAMGIGIIWAGAMTALLERGFVTGTGSVEGANPYLLGGTRQALFSVLGTPALHLLLSPCARRHLS